MVREVRGGFSLIEVVISLAVTAFALLPIIALLPMGMKTAQESVDKTVAASIAQQIRAEIQNISFRSNDPENLQNITNLKDRVLYYTIEGIQTTKTDDSYAPAYYVVRFVAKSANVAGESFKNDNAQLVQATLEYPYQVPAIARKKVTFPLFIARQPGLI